MMEVSLFPFSEGTLQTVSCSCLNERAAINVHVVQDSVLGAKKGQVNTASTSHQGRQEGTTQQRREARGNSHSSSLSDALHTCAQTRILACSHKKQLKKGRKQLALNLVTVGVQVSHVADLVLSSSSLLHGRQPKSRDSYDRSGLRSRGKFSSIFVAQYATAAIASLHLWESGT